MKLEVLTPPVEEPVSLLEAKRYARLHLDLTDDDALVQSLITSARELIEARIARRFVTATLRETREIPEDGRVRLLRAPVAEIISVEVDGEPIPTPLDIEGEATIEVGHPGATATITYKAGYGDASKVPETAKLAILLLVVHWLDNRSPVSSQTANALPFSIESLASSLSWGGEGPPK